VRVAVAGDVIDAPLARSAGEKAAVFARGKRADVRILRVVEDLPLPFRVHAEQLSFDARRDGDIAALENFQVPDVRLRGIEEDRLRAALGIDAVHLPVRRAADEQRAVAEGHGVDLRLRRREEHLHVRTAEAVDLAVVAGAEEEIAVRRRGLREHEGIGERSDLAHGRSHEELAARGDGKTFELTAQKLFGGLHAPELRRHREGL
jgi:hypothetical protein